MKTTRTLNAMLGAALVTFTVIAIPAFFAPVLLAAAPVVFMAALTVCYGKN